MEAKREQRCLYEVLGLPVRSNDMEELKRAYRKAALLWHPDKHGDKSAQEQEEASQRFLEIQEAYRVLSDPQEKAWYDDHREDILRGKAADGDDEGASGQVALPNLWPYFASRCYTSYNDDDPTSFYAVYAAAFAEVWAAEPSDASPQPPPFGDSKTPWKHVNKFYQYWGFWVSQSTFAWADRWRLPDGESRDIRRQMKKENAQYRAAEKRKWQETVRQLTAHVRQRDKRVMAEQQRSMAMAEQQKAARIREEEEKRLARQLERMKVKEEVEEMDSEEAEYWDNMRRKYGEDGVVKLDGREILLFLLLG